MGRRRVYRTPEEARQIRNGYHRNYQRERRRSLSKEPRGLTHVAENNTRSPPPSEIVADAERRNRASHSSLTAQLCGDPKPGQSALDLVQATAVREE